MKTRSGIQRASQASLACAAVAWPFIRVIGFAIGQGQTLVATVGGGGRASLTSPQIRVWEPRPSLPLGRQSARMVPLRAISSASSSAGIIPECQLYHWHGQQRWQRDSQRCGSVPFARNTKLSVNYTLTVTAGGPGVGVLSAG